MSWLEERTGAGALVRGVAARLSRPLPPNARGAALGGVALFLLGVQIASGALLAVYYVPAWDQAHASVGRIAREVTLGWLVRSVHLWSAHLLIATVLLHLVRSFARGAYEKPREVTWLAGVALLGVLMGAAFTGQMLPMDDEAVKGAEVAAAYAEEGGIASLVRGDKVVGQPMLTRMFAAHVIVIPLAALALVAAHLALVGRHRLEGAETLEGSSPAFLQQLVMAIFAATALLAVLAFVFPAGVGAPPGAPDAPASAKPLWMFLPAYQAAKFVSGPATLLLLVGPPAFLVLVPFLPRRVAVAAGIVVLAAALAFGIWGAAS